MIFPITRMFYTFSFTADTQNLLNFSAKDLSFGESSSDSKYPFCKFYIRPHVLCFVSLKFCVFFSDHDCSASSIHLTENENVPIAGISTEQTMNNDAHDQMAIHDDATPSEVVEAGNSDDNFVAPTALPGKIYFRTLD